ncbi:MAG TPA: CPBP family intramembrane glutamic endopeptidase [Gemmatimonadaceae bacterium]|nr:CPBP family intramembrane glutamic endopeptidase [Gemmatimonadaceae bacterium]
MAVSHKLLYLVLFAFECGFVLLVSRRTARDAQTVGDLIGGRWRSWRDLARDIVLAAAMWGAWLGIASLLTMMLPAVPNTAALSMLPNGPLESAMWIVLSVSAGFAEELLFRGYLQRKLGVFAQAVIFGVLHFYQGLFPVIRIVVYGLLFGAVARWRRSLRPGMIAHAWTDIAAGLLRW